MRVFLPALLLSAAALASFAQTTPPPTPSNSATAAPSASSPAMSTYHNDTLHLSYTYPSTYTDASSTVGPAFEASVGHGDLGSNDAIRCITLPFSVIDNAGGQFSLVILVRADAACMKKKSFNASELAELTHGEIQGLTASGAHTQFDSPVPFTTQGHPAQFLHGTFELPTGQMLHALVVCMLLKPDVACWQFLSSSDQGLHTMSAFPVALEGSQPEPLVPPTAFAKP